MAFADNTSYSATWDFTDYSATVFPVSYVDAVVDAKPEYQTRNDAEKKIWARYDSNEVVGVPVSLQLVCQRLEEEKALELIGVVAEALKPERALKRTDVKV